MFDLNVNKICLGTDGAASSWVVQILPLRVKGSITYSAPLSVSNPRMFKTIAYAPIGLCL